MSLPPLCLSPIGVIRSPYKEKFSVPRQANLVQDGLGMLELLPPYNQAEAVRGLEQFSHLWLIFHFNHIPQGKWHPTVRPPRLGGNQRIGVFATRATHRPNPLGLSKVALRHIECAAGKVRLHLGAVDLVDGTPIFDIKPYIAYADSEPQAHCGFAQQQPIASLQVIFSANALAQGKKIEQNQPHFCRFVQEVIAQDPRPAYQRQQANGRLYGIHLYDYNIRWHILPEHPEVAQIVQIEPWHAP